MACFKHFLNIFELHSNPDAVQSTTEGSFHISPIPHKIYASHLLFQSWIADFITLAWSSLCFQQNKFHLVTLTNSKLMTKIDKLVDYNELHSIHYILLTDRHNNYIKPRVIWSYRNWPLISITKFNLNLLKLIHKAKSMQNHL